MYREHVRSPLGKDLGPQLFSSIERAAQKTHSDQNSQEADNRERSPELNVAVEEIARLAKTHH